MNYYITVYETRTSNTYTYSDLGEGHALAMIRMVASGTHFLIADASDGIAREIHPRIRTSWFTRNLPSHACPGRKTLEPGQVLHCTRDTGHSTPQRQTKCIARHPEYRTFTPDNVGEVRR